MKRLLLIIGLALVICGTTNTNSFAAVVEPYANYETSSKQDTEDFHKNVSDKDKYYGYIRFSSTIKTSLSTGNSTLSGKSNTNFPSNGSVLMSEYKKCGYLNSSNRYFYVQWDYRGSYNGKVIRTGIHQHRY